MVAVLVAASPAGRERHRAATLVDSQGAERAKAEAGVVDGDGGDAVVCHIGCNTKSVHVLIAAAPVAEDGHRPPAGRLGARRQEEVEIDFVHTLHSGSAAARAYLRNVLAWVDLIIRR